MANFSKTKIALAHDSFTQEGGAERVINALHELFPDAPIYTLVCSRQFLKKYKDWDIRTSWLQIFYNFVPKLQFLLPLIPWAVSSLDFSGYDLVISSSSGFIKNISVPKNTLHINYCHTPARFLWSDGNYLEQEVPVFIRPIVRVILRVMKKWDYKGAQRVSFFIANSVEVQKRIQLYYLRNSEVIYPFIDTDFWKLTRKKADYFLLAGRLQAHKKNNLIVQIFNEIRLPLHVVGIGREEKHLRSMAKSNTVFLGRLTDEELRDEYSGALGYIFPQLEDFGLMPLEAASSGTATLAYGKGGALETIIPGITGEFFNNYDSEKIKQIILNWDFLKYKTENLRTQAEKFDKKLFKQKFENFILNLPM